MHPVGRRNKHTKKSCAPSWLHLQASYLHRASSTYKHFIVQLMHNYIISRYNQNNKICKSTPTCFGLQRIHHQGTLYSTWLKLKKKIHFCNFSQVLYKAADDGSSVIRNMLEYLYIFYNFNGIYSYVFFIVHKLDNKIFIYKIYIKIKCTSN